jgi:hypothetical protein
MFWPCQALDESTLTINLLRWSGCIWLYIIVGNNINKWGNSTCWCYSLVFSCMKGQWWLWSDGSWVYIFLFNQCLTLLKFWVLLQPVLYVLWFPRPIELNKHNETEIPTTFTHTQRIYINTVSFIGGEEPEKTTDLPQVTDNLYHIMEYTLPLAGFKLTTLAVTGIDYIGRSKIHLPYDYNHDYLQWIYTMDATLNTG